MYPTLSWACRAVRVSLAPSPTWPNEIAGVGRGFPEDCCRQSATFSFFRCLTQAVIPPVRQMWIGEEISISTLAEHMHHDMFTSLVSWPHIQLVSCIRWHYHVFAFPLWVALPRAFEKEYVSFSLCETLKCLYWLHDWCIYKWWFGYFSSGVYIC